MTETKKAPLCIYVFLLDPEDQGAFEHVRAVCGHMSRLGLITMSNVTTDALGANGEHHQMSLTFHGKSLFSQFLKLLSFQFRAMKLIRSTSKKNGRNVVVVQRQIIGMFILAVYSKLLGIPFVAEVNGLLAQDLVDRRKGRVLRLMNAVTEFITYSLSKKIVSVHQNLVPFLVERYRLPEERFVVIENGTYSRDWCRPEEAKRNLGLPLETAYVGYLGSFSSREGVDNLIRAIRAMRRNDVRLMVVGGKSEAELGQLRSLAEAEGVSNLVNFVGYKPYEEAMQYMEACDVLVHLRRKATVGKSDSQGSPLKMLDYHNVGRPVVATDISSYQYIREMGFGELVPDEDIPAAARAIERLLELPDGGLDAGRRAHEFVNQHKLWKHSISKLEEALIREIG